MQFVLRLFRDPPARTSRAGFTLIELIVSLFVISVATTIFMHLYATSIDLGKLSRNRSIAVGLAEEQLGLVMREPGTFVWDYANPDSAGYFRIREAEDDPRAGVVPPLPKATLPADSAFKRESVVFDQFRWKSIGKLGARGLFYEVTVDVHWEQAGRVQSITMTGAVPRGRVEPGWSESK